MVRIERISPKAPDQEIDPTGERFKLLDVYVQEPTANPDDLLKVSARPYEFEDNQPSKYATSCPHCGQGIWFDRYEIQSALSKFFISCPECGEGAEAPAQPMVDPFVNPVTQKIAETLLDSDLSTAQHIKSDDTKTVKEKLEAANADLADLAPCINVSDKRDPPHPIQSTLDEAPSDNETDEMIGPSELEQILGELEDK